MRVPSQFALDHLTALECTPPELVYLAARAGYQSVGLRTMPLGIPGEPKCDVARDPQLMRRTREALVATGLGISDMELVRITPGMDPCSYEPALAAGAELGATDVTVSVWTPDLSYAREMFDTVCDLAKQYELRMNLEFVAIAEIRTLGQAATFLRSVDSDNVGIVLDAYHVYRCGVTSAEIRALPAKWFHFCQLCDAPAEPPGSPEELREEVRGRRLFLGEGDIDVAAIVANMPETTCALEIPNIERIRELGPQEYVNRCLQTSKCYFARYE